MGVHSVSKRRMRPKNNQDLWLEFLLLNGSPELLIDWLYEHFTKIKGRHSCLRIIRLNKLHAVPLIAAENILQIICVISRKASHC